MARRFPDSTKTLAAGRLALSAKYHSRERRSRKAPAWFERHAVGSIGLALTRVPRSVK
jgi:hypothetical protein